MALSSMTGFARASGALDGLHWQWEVKSVNGKGLETRCRLASGFEHLEAAGCARASRGVSSAAIFRSHLTCDHGSASEVFSVNEVALEQLLAISRKVAREDSAARRRASMACLGLRGVVEVVTQPVEPDVAARRDRAMLDSLDGALRRSGADARRRGRAARGQVIGGAARPDCGADRRGARLPGTTAGGHQGAARRAGGAAARGAFRFRRDAASSGGGADRDARRHPGGDRPACFAHVEAARGLAGREEPAGRKLEFLAQEFNREANTLCSKAIDRSVTDDRPRPQDGHRSTSRAGAEH